MCLTKTQSLTGLTTENRERVLTVVVSLMKAYEEGEVTAFFKTAATVYTDIYPLLYTQPCVCVYVCVASCV